jgi:hypothetical protein
VVIAALESHAVAEFCMMWPSAIPVASDSNRLKLYPYLLFLVQAPRGVTIEKLGALDRMMKSVVGRAFFGVVSKNGK